jgi:hypothetical protein
MWKSIVDRLAATRRQYQIYAAVYLLCGFAMNGLGKLLHIAEFVSWWQVISCYGLYLLPASLLVRRLPLLRQYLYGLLTLAPLELVGYAIGSSRAFDANLIDHIVGPRNFTLVMVVFFGWSLPVGNRIVALLDARLPTRARAARGPLPSILELRWWKIGRLPATQAPQVQDRRGREPRGRTIP